MVYFAQIQPNARERQAPVGGQLAAVVVQQRLGAGQGHFGPCGGNLGKPPTAMLQHASLSSVGCTLGLAGALTEFGRLCYDYWDPNIGQICLCPVGSMVVSTPGDYNIFTAPFWLTISRRYHYHVPSPPALLSPFPKFQSSHASIPPIWPSKTLHNMPFLKHTSLPLCR